MKEREKREGGVGEVGRVGERGVGRVEERGRCRRSKESRRESGGEMLQDLHVYMLTSIFT